MNSQAIRKAMKGKAAKEGKTSADVDQKQLAKGIKVEKEHTQNRELAKRISVDHLVELPDYYTRLDKMESQAKKSAGHMSSDQPAPGESQQDIETKDKKAKVTMSGDKIEPRKVGPWDTEGSPENVGETYKDLATKEAYWVGFARRCAAHGTTPEQVFAAGTKMAMEHAMAAPNSVAFKESDIPVKRSRKDTVEKNEHCEDADTNTVRRETDGKKEEAPDILTSSVKGHQLERSKG